MKAIQHTKCTHIIEFHVALVPLERFTHLQSNQLEISVHCTQRKTHAAFQWMYFNACYALECFLLDGKSIRINNSNVTFDDFGYLKEAFISNRFHLISNTHTHKNTINLKCCMHFNMRVSSGWINSDKNAVICDSLDKNCHVFFSPNVNINCLKSISTRNW